MAAAIVLAVQGLAAALAARWLGDPGPSQDGRATPNPLPHVDLLGAIGFLLFRAGWIKPLEVDTRRFRSRASSVVALLVPTLAVVVLAAAMLILRPAALRLIDGNAAITVSTVMLTTHQLAVRSSLLALLPVPPLLGAYLLTAVRPGASNLVNSSSARWLGGLIVLGLLLAGVLEPALAAGSGYLRALLGY